MNTLNAVILAGPTNPLTGVTPSMDVFGLQFTGAVSIILGGIWALVLAAGAAVLLISGVKWAYASKVTGHDQSIMSGAEDFKRAAVAFGVIAGASIVIAAILAIIQRAQG